jgi:thymidylate synthase
VELVCNSGSFAYLDLLDQLIKNGRRSSPRSQVTLELLDVNLVITDSYHVHTLRTTRNSSHRIAATEAAHLIAGVSSLEQLNLASGYRFTQFADDGRLRGAYGPRAFQQLRRAVAKLADDTSTRQAVVTIWRGDELETATRDVPCTLSLQFTIRDDQLNMRTSMRSNDAWLGLPYDLEVFGALHKTVASALSIPPGTYTHSVGSMHLYERDREKASAVRDTDLVQLSRRPVLPDGATPGIIVLSPLQRWDINCDAVRRVVMRDSVSSIYFTHQSWQQDLVDLVPQLPLGNWQVCERCRYLTDGSCQECPTIPLEPLEFPEESSP